MSSEQPHPASIGAGQPVAGEAGSTEDQSVDDIRKQVETEQALSDAQRRVKELEDEVTRIKQEVKNLEDERSGAGAGGLSYTT